MRMFATRVALAGLALAFLCGEVFAAGSQHAPLAAQKASPLSAPQHVVAAYTPDGVLLTWEPVTGATSYSIRRGSNGPLAELAIKPALPAGSKAYLDKGSYDHALYQILALADGRAAESAVVTYTPPPKPAQPPPPPPPSKPAAQAVGPAALVAQPLAVPLKPAPLLLPSKPALTAVAAPAAPVKTPTAAAAPAGGSAAVTEPTWPQAFALNPGERTGYGFSVGQAGPVVVSANWSGTSLPMVLSLVKPGGTVVEKQGSAAITVSETATADDVKRGALWRVHLRFLQESAPAVAVVSAVPRAEVKPAATGSVSVQRPAPDLVRAAAELQLHTGTFKAVVRSATGVARVADPDLVLAQRQSEELKRVAAQHTLQLGQIKGRLAAAAYQLSLQGINARALGGLGDAGAVPAKKLLSAPAQPAPAAQTAQTQSAATGTAGSNAPATVAAAPVITALSVQEGQPGAPVLITGTGFSETANKVHFVVGNGKNLPADITAWSDTQILVSVPKATAVPAFDGQVFVERSPTVRSQWVPFKFIPTYAFDTIKLTADRVLGGPAHVAMLERQFIDYPFFLWGGRGDDEFNLRTRLKNGWVVDSAFLANWSLDGQTYPLASGAASDVRIVEVRTGTDSPYLKVHWWTAAFSEVTYSPRVVIKGPLGLPWQ